MLLSAGVETWRLKRESAAQGLDTTGIQFVCSLACYTPDMLEQGGADAEGVWVNMFVGSSITVENVSGTDVEMVQRTDYPWNGKVAITVNPAAIPIAKFTTHKISPSITTAPNRVQNPA